MPQINPISWIVIIITFSVIMLTINSNLPKISFAQPNSLSTQNNINNINW